MSMTARFVAVTPALLDQFKRDPEPVPGLFMESAPAAGLGALLNNPRLQERLQALGPQLLSGALANLKPEQREAMLKRLAALGVSEEAFKAGTGGAALGKLMAARASKGGSRGGAASSAGATVDLDKNWHGVHFLLCGAAEPGAALLSQVVMGGTEIGEDEHGYGPARYFDSARTAEIAQALGDANLEAAMRARFDPAAMNAAQIYPFGWSPGRLDELIASFHALRDFFAAASAGRQAVITCLV
jgi:hypothetical protein